MENNIKVTGVTDRGRYHWVPRETVEQWIQKADDENRDRDEEQRRIDYYRAKTWEQDEY